MIVVVTEILTVSIISG